LSILSVKGGESTASQSSWEIWSGLRFIGTPLSGIRFPKADDPAYDLPFRIGQNMQASTNKPKGYPACFRIVPSVIFRIDCLFPIKVF
jgi:hypothetical protein